MHLPKWLLIYKKEDKVDAELPDIDSLIKEISSDEFIEKKINDILGDLLTIPTQLSQPSGDFLFKDN